MLMLPDSTSAYQPNTSLPILLHFRLTHLKGTYFLIFFFHNAGLIEIILFPCIFHQACGFERLTI